MLKMPIKVGTMPMSVYYIKYKRKIPTHGDWIYIKEIFEPRGVNWERVYVQKYVPELDMLFVDR